ncbi:MAG: hypothetical protein MJ025_07210, partial [Victivallaceae bacterium]|nr:hypothetical protein [Victivallaceae bacterium]
MNDFVLFRCRFAMPSDGRALLHVAASTCYRAKVDGRFLAHGPMRGPGGMFRVDELDIRSTGGESVTLEIEVSGANVNSFDFMDQPSFLLAEVTSDNEVLAATGSDFIAYDLSQERIKRVSRFSYQRMFFEAYRVNPRRDDLVELELERCPDVRLLPARLPQPEYAVDRSFHRIGTIRRRYDSGAGLKRDNSVDNLCGANGTQSIQNRALTLVGKQGFKGFPMDELEVNAFLELGRYVRDDSGDIESVVFEGNSENAGFPMVRVNCLEPGRLVLMYDELLQPDGGVDPLRLDMTGAVFWDLTEPGEYALEGFEPTAFKFAEVFMHGGKATVTDFALREYKAGRIDIGPRNDDRDISLIFRAGCESFRCNAVDVLTDCPTRERGGYIGDSFFTARAALSLTGSTLHEKLFLENYALAPRHDGLPDGAFPMEYPGDHPTGQFIPNWGMWLVMELEEYLERSGDTGMIDAFKGKVKNFISYMDGFLNDDGLLEDLPSWVFIEWSKANTFAGGVNYPSNMLYARALEAAGKLYGEPGWTERAKTMRRTISEQSFDGEWFRDHGVRRADGPLDVPPDRTETCQYYAFFLGVASRQTHPVLWNRLVSKFGPERVRTGMWPDIWPSKLIMGRLLRLDP